MKSKCCFQNRFLTGVFLGILVLLVCGSGHKTVAQAKYKLPVKMQKGDTLDIYLRIKKIAYKRKVTKALYHTIFVDPAPLTYDRNIAKRSDGGTDHLTDLKDRVIRTVEITVLDPFGYSANDTTRTVANTFQGLSNKTRIRTQKYVIRDRLLFERSDKLDPLEITESERLLREATFINDARIFVLPVLSSNDSVDVVVVVQDKWALSAVVSLSNNGGYTRIRNRNFLGTGHSFQQRFGYYTPEGFDFAGTYSFSNIKNSYVSADLFYQKEGPLSRAGFSANREFYSPLTRYAGGLYYALTDDLLDVLDSQFMYLNRYRIVYSQPDAWVARAFFSTLSGRKYRRNLNFTGAVRFTGFYFHQRPFLATDPEESIRNRSMVLGSFGLSFRTYYKDQYIYRFGANEDIPEGFNIQWIQGYRFHESLGQSHYTGIDFSRGTRMNDMGYLSSNIAFGSYYNGRTLPDMTAQLGVNYFSGLITARRWYIRQFVNFRYLTGMNKEPGIHLNINPGELYGIQGDALDGRGKMTIGFETIGYAPYNLIGFKFAPVLIAGFGQLYKGNWLAGAGKMYQVYAVGLLVRNESLLNSSFEITLGMYPNDSPSGKTTWRLNPVAGFTLKLRSFAAAKPQVLIYR